MTSVFILAKLHPTVKSNWISGKILSVKLKMGPLRFRKGELKVKTFTTERSPLVKVPFKAIKLMSRKGLVKVTFTNLKGPLSKTFKILKV